MSSVLGIHSRPGMASPLRAFGECRNLHAALLAAECNAYESTTQQLRRATEFRTAASDDTESCSPQKPVPLQRRCPPSLLQNSSSEATSECKATPSSSSCATPRAKRQPCGLPELVPLSPLDSRTVVQQKPSVLPTQTEVLSSNGSSPRAATPTFLSRRFRHLIAFMCFVILTLGLLLAALCVIELYIPDATLAWIEGRTVRHQTPTTTSIRQDAETELDAQATSQVAVSVIHQEDPTPPLPSTTHELSAPPASKCEDVAEVLQCRSSRRCCPGGPGAAHCGQLDCTWNEARQAYDCPGSWMRDNCALTCGLCDGPRS